MSIPGSESPSFAGRRVVTFESRLSGVLADLIVKYGGIPIEAPALREIPLGANAEALDFADRLMDGRFDIVISNAGITGEVTEIINYPSDAFARTLAVHVLGAFHVLKHTIPHVPDGGSIIITSSVVGLIGAPGASGYVTAKHAQVGLMRAAAKELAPRRIRVNTMHPGPTSTPFQDSIETRATGLPREEAAKAFDAMIPLGRHTTTEEIARGMLYLASDESAMVTSHTLSIDGGMSG